MLAYLHRLMNQFMNYINLFDAGLCHWLLNSPPVSTCGIVNFKNGDYLLIFHDLKH